MNASRSRRPRSSRALAGLVPVLLALPLAACSDDAEVAAGPQVVWAGTVCTSVEELRSAVGALDDGITLDATSSVAASDQLKAELEAGVTQVVDAADEVALAVAAVPPESSAEIAQAQEVLGAQAQTVQDGVEEVRAAAADLPGAESTREVLAAASDLIAPTAALTLNGRQMVAALRDYATSAESALEDAFGAAPACQQLREDAGSASR